MRPRLVIMLKEPMAGRVKTRLGRDIGMTAAAWWFRHQSTALIRRMQDPRWDTWLFVAPDTALNSRSWPAHLPRLGQGRGNLGARMTRGLNHHAGPVVLIGGDIPGISKLHIADAFRGLGRKNVVLGPAQDGGFWLVGVRRAAPKGMFEGVRWSSETTLEDTLSNLPRNSLAFVATLSDVDTINDLRQTHAP